MELLKLVIAGVLSAVALNVLAQVDQDDEPQWVPTEQKNFSAKERAAECRKYEGRFIAHYGEVYRVENCKRRRLPDTDAIQSLKGIVSVENDTVIKIPEGKPLESGSSGKKFQCATFNQRYVSSSVGDVYWIENCTFYGFADWETYLQHRKERGKGQKPPVEISSEAFLSMKQGADIPSILNEEFKSVLEGTAGVDVIPVDEACAGLEGKYVTYYSRFYRIERCFKREIDAQDFLRKYPKRARSAVELTSEQWLSLPDGKPL